MTVGLQRQGHPLHQVGTHVKDLGVGAGETAPQVGALVALAEDLGSLPSVCTVAHNFLHFQFRGSDALASTGNAVCMVRMYTCWKKKEKPKNHKK